MGLNATKRQLGNLKYRILFEKINMNEDAYIENRLDRQIEWYSNKSATNKKLYISSRIIEIISAATIPFLSGMGDKISYSAWIIGSLGLLIAIIASLNSLFKYQENWIEYRSTVEQLKHEKFLYLTSTQPYDNKNKFSVLVKSVESLISKEHSKWLSTFNKKFETINKE